METNWQTVKPNWQPWESQAALPELLHKRLLINATALKQDFADKLRRKWRNTVLFQSIHPSRITDPLILAKFPGRHASQWPMGESISQIDQKWAKIWYFGGLSRRFSPLAKTKILANASRITPMGELIEMVQ